METIDGGAMLTIGGVRDRDVVEDGEAGTSGLELGADNLEEVGHLQALEVKGAGCGRRGDGCVGGGGLCGGNTGSERGASKALLEGAALLLSVLIGDKALD